MKHHPLVRTIYLYLFALVGLTLLVVGVVRFIDMGLKTFIFTKADHEYRMSYIQPPIYRSVEETKDLLERGEISERERESLEILLADYENWKKRQEEIDPITSRRHRDASSNLAMIITGLPLYFYHWGIIRRESGKTGDSKQ